MLRHGVRSTLLAALLFPALAAGQSAPAGPAQARADAIVARSADAGGPGAVAAVVSGGRILYRGAAGLASLEQNTPLTNGTILDIGSVAKQLTAFALVLRHRRIGVVELEPRGPDVFSAGGGLGELRFRRDDAGRVGGFDVSNGRTRGVRFEIMP